MEETPCNLCGANHAELVYIEKDRLLKLPGTFRLVRCKGCGHVYLNPRPIPEAMAAYYPDDYEPYSIAPEDERSPIRRLDRSYGYWKRARVLTAVHPQGGRILDVGCATGNFLHALRQMGPWEGYGVDVSPKATEYAQQRFGFHTFTGELTRAGYPDAYFDVVTMWDVMEHVYDPKATLEEIHRILKPNGMLLIRVPNGASWDARLFGPYWVGLDAPRHLSVFSPKTLRRFLEGTGFRVKIMRSFVLSYHPFALSVQFWLDERLPDGRLKRALTAVNHSWVPRLLSVPLFLVLSYFNNTFATTAVATKQDTASS